MTDDLAAFLDAAEARAAAATPGPWEDDESVRRDGTWVVLGDGLVRAIGATSSDAAFIAAARSDMPALVAMVRAVLALHSPRTLHEGQTYCPSCKDPEGRQGVCWYPCPTVRDVAALLAAIPPTPTAEETP